jgi:diguanylate cyclase (GGDEF)-like protein
MIDSQEQTNTTILLVDDSRAIRRIIGRTLIESGYRVLEASDGQECLQVARQVSPSLILLDIDMPVLDGLSTLQLMRKDPTLESIPVLFLTARTSGSDVATGLQLGAKDYLRKPCEPEELLARVATALTASRLQQSLDSRAKLLDDLSTTDPLTGLGNRRRFDLWLADLRRTTGDACPVGAAIADADRFKSINDEQGHLTGDTVLQILARRIRSAVPEGALIVRWGGEEFLVVQSGGHANAIAHTAEAVRAAVAAEPMAVGVDRLLWVTVSVGCATGTLGQIMATIDAADSALYDAKHAGRNCVVGAD